jgi:hypothetical protein
MKAVINGIGAAAVLVLFVFQGVAGSGSNKPLPDDVKLLPDLVAELKLKTEPLVHAGKEGFLIHPYYTVRNKGIGVAKNFQVRLEWKFSDKAKFRFNSKKDVGSLKGGESLSWGGHASESYGWFPRQDRVGYRVIVDYERSVAEKKEDNNSATAFFPSNK